MRVLRLFAKIDLRRLHQDAWLSDAAVSGIEKEVWEVGPKDNIRFSKTESRRSDDAVEDNYQDDASASKRGNLGERGGDRRKKVVERAGIRTASS